MATGASSSSSIRNVPLVALCLLVGGSILASARPIAENIEASAAATATNSSDSELLLVQAIYRHGDRTPISLAGPHDPYSNFTWVDGLGALTLRGKARMFHYGQTLRERYSAYLDNILSKNVRAQSSPKRRCLETSLAVLAGLMPPKNSSRWSGQQELAHLWQPIAVESSSPDRAWLLNPDTECAAATQIKDRLPTDDPEMKKFLEDNKAFIEKVSQLSGQKFPSWVQVGWLFDAIFTERTFFGDKVQQPGWLSQVGNDTLARLSKFNEYQFSIYRHWPKYVKLRAGLLLNQLIDNMKEAAALKELSAKNKKLNLFGTHDTMVAPLMLALGFFKEQPTYGSGITLEVRRDRQSGQAQVHVFYANVTNNADLDNFKVDFVPLKLNQSERFSKLCHETHCSLDNFSASLREYLVTDIEKECTLPKH